MTHAAPSQGFVAGIKDPLRRYRHRVRTAYIKRFFAFSSEDLLKALRRLGIESGDVVCVHSSFDRFMGFTGNVGDALKTLQQAVGQDGGLVMPTQPFNESAVKYVQKHPITDIARAPSLMGMMTEILRRTRGAVRTINPTHPVATWGSRGVGLVGRDWEAGTPCGRGTAYHRMIDASGKILLLGTGVQPMTFYHCVEELIEPRMPASPFTREGFHLRTKDAAGTLHESDMRLFEPGLSSRRRMSLLVPELKSRGYWRDGRVGRLEMILLNAADVLDACEAKAARGEFCYIDEPGHGTQTQGPE